MSEGMSDLDRFFQRSPAEGPPAEARRLGMVIGGSLSKGLSVRLDRGAVLEGMAVGRYVVVHGQTGRRFFSIVTDVVLDAANAAMEKTPPDVSDPFLAQVHQGTTTFGRLEVSPMLVLEAGSSGQPKPVKTVPVHFSPVFEAAEDDVDRVFGAADAHHFFVGAPLDMEKARVHLNLARFVERSGGVFGKSGTGKTFLTRTLLAGVIKQRAAVNLIFDMHNEYGWHSKGEHGHLVKGLKQLFPGQVSVMTLDRESSDRRGSKWDAELRIGYEQIEPEDVDMLAPLMGLTDVQIGALYYLRRRLGSAWIGKLLEEKEADDGGTGELEALLKDGNILGGTLAAIQRKLGLFRRFDFLQAHVQDDAVGRIMEHLDRGIHVVLEFGRHGSTLEAYMLVANYLTRRIHRRYVERKEKALGREQDEPLPLVITIEEAHKFLDPAIANQTIFGTIARELRKYNVTLLVVDQRPSGIDAEVMSQIGTRVTALLDNEADIQAVFTGVSGAQQLRQVLARLDTQQQALILGHAVPMPVVVQTRTYGPELYAEVGYVEGELLQARSARNVGLMRGTKDKEGYD